MQMRLKSRGRSDARSGDWWVNLARAVDIIHWGCRHVTCRNMHLALRQLKKPLPVWRYMLCLFWIPYTFQVQDHDRVDLGSPFTALEAIAPALLLRLDRLLPAS